MSNVSLQSAKTKKNDEFYTDISDIEKELEYYKASFKGKHIYLNCDNPKESHFWNYFESNFDELGLSKLTSTYYNEFPLLHKLLFI